MAGELAASKKGINAAAQAVAAVVLVGGLFGGAWVMDEIEESNYVDRPAACSSGKDEDLPEEYVSGAELCAALNRPDLPALLGTPDEQALTAGGSASWFSPVGGADKIATPSAEVQLETYSVQLSASYNRLPVAQTARFLGVDAQKTTVLGRPAVLYSDRTIAISFDLGGGKNGTGTRTGPGGIARSLVVAKDAQDGGGSFEIVIWRQDGRLPDDAALFRTAEQVLPTIPGWTAG